MPVEISIPVFDKSADDLSKDAGRELRRGDVLIDNRYPGTPESWEIVDPRLGGRTLIHLGPIKIERKSNVRVRQLTPYGLSEEVRLFSRGDKRWSNLVRCENR